MLLKQLDGGSEDFAEAIRVIRRAKYRLARTITAKAERIIPGYGRVCNSLRLSRQSLYGKVALADLLPNVDFSRGLRKILCYVGLYRPNGGRYSHRLKKAAICLAVSYYKKWRVRAREVGQLLKMVREVLLEDRPGGWEKSRMEAGQ